MKARHSIALAVLLAGGLSGMSYQRLLAPLPVTPAPVEAQIAVEVYGLGTVEARTLVRTGFQVLGTLAEVRVDQHDRVRAGEILAVLDSREQRLQLAQAEATLQQAMAALGQAQAGLARNQVQLADKRRTLQRLQRLAPSGAVSLEQVETAQAAVDMAAAELRQAEAVLALAEADRNRAEAALRHETVLLERHTLTAPFAALVVSRLQEPGSVLTAGTPVLTLLDPQTLWIQAYVDESRAGALALGQAAEIRLRSRPGERYAGRVARIDVESDRVGEERRVMVAFDRIPEDLHLGEQAEVVIQAARVERAVVLPEWALQEQRDGRAVAWALERGRLKLQPVRLGPLLLDGRRLVMEPPAGLVLLAEVPADARPGRKAVLRAQAGTL
ncbi:MAG TPA: efflux RND transporter periplasmic adaptor subunit [Candidatus Competibacteraceae bacterium]|nr:efflux RND transporter periplasmic adaptor subunit [Candidatus Competibacteraceae bacterium]